VAVEVTSTTVSQSWESLFGVTQISRVLIVTGLVAAAHNITGTINS
jgi:hypothetical protein